MKTIKVNGRRFKIGVGFSGNDCAYPRITSEEVWVREITGGISFLIGRQETGHTHQGYDANKHVRVTKRWELAAMAIVNEVAWDANCPWLVNARA